MDGVVLVHAGAGYHSKSKERAYRKVCARACKQAVAVMNQGGNATAAAAAAIEILEDSPLTNAGYGSCLNLEGGVECDASLMDSRGKFAAVGAVKGIRNPIQVAHSLLLNQEHPPLDGREPPRCLMGEGARVWAMQHGIPVIDPASMISGTAREKFDKYKTLIQRVESNGPLPKRAKVCKDSQLESSTLLDTVGVVCLDKQGQMSAGLSSGGIAMKHLGRIGQAAMYGCGCWVDLDSKVSLTTSGCGEHIMCTLLAKELADALLSANDNEPRNSGEATVCDPTGLLLNAVKSHFLENKRLRAVERKLAGAIVLVVTDDASVELIWLHTTRSMCVAYMSTADSKPISSVSRQSDRDHEGKVCSIQGTVLKRSTK